MFLIRSFFHWKKGHESRRFEREGVWGGGGGKGLTESGGYPFVGDSSLQGSQPAKKGFIKIFHKGFLKRVLFALLLCRRKEEMCKIWILNISDVQKRMPKPPAPFNPAVAPRLSNQAYGITPTTNLWTLLLCPCVHPPLDRSTFWLSF